MSKLQSSIEKAIQRSRHKKGAGDEFGPGSSSKDGDRSPSALMRIFKFAKPRNQVMEENRIVAAIGDRNAKSAYNVLRTRVLQRLRSHDWHSILVTSPGPGEGKTVTASNLAISLARDVNQSVILVDLDLMRSSIAKYLGINLDVTAGVGDFLLGKAEFEQIVYSPGEIERLVLVPNREPVENSSDLLASPRMKELAARLRSYSQSSIIVYDMPPVLACDDVLAFCPNVDAVLLVVAQGKTDRVALEKTVAMLSEYQLLGVVLNMSNELSGNAYSYYY